MSILVTGGAGYIGSHMALHLLDAGRDVVVLDNLTTGFRAMVPRRATFLKGDIGDVDFVSSAMKVYGVTGVIHFAGSIVVPDSMSDPLGYYLNNTVKSRALMEAAVKADVRAFIFSSTAAVYGMTGVDPVSEDAPVAPISPYGSSKRMTETMLADAGRAHGLPYAALRYFNVAGADPKRRAGQCSAKATHLIKVASEAATGMRDGMSVFGEDYETRDGTCVRDYIHVSDLVAAHALALDHLEAGKPSLIANCGYGRGYTVREVIDAVKRQSNHDFSVETVAPRPGDPASIVADATRLRGLGWTPKHDDLDGIVSDAIAWQRLLNEHARQLAA